MIYVLIASVISTYLVYKTMLWGLEKSIVTYMLATFIALFITVALSFMFSDCFAQDELVNECGETKIQEASSSSYCMSPSEDDCEGGPAKSRVGGPKECLMLDTYEFMDKYELVND